MQKGRRQKNKENDSDGLFPDAEFFGNAVVGTKGQIVIPKEARDQYGIESGDKLIIFGGKGGVLAVMKADKLNELLEGITLPEHKS